MADEWESGGDRGLWLSLFPHETDCFDNQRILKCLADEKDIIVLSDTLRGVFCRAATPVAAVDVFGNVVGEEVKERRGRLPFAPFGNTTVSFNQEKIDELIEHVERSARDRRKPLEINVGRVRL